MSLRFNNITKQIPASERRVKAVIIILYIVGIVGSVFTATREFFIALTPFILILSVILLFIFHSSGFDAKTMLIILLIYLLGFSLEVAGVKTGSVFGSYSYGKGLGIKVFETPLIIGFNWVLLVYCTNTVFEKIPVSNIVKIVGASLLMVLYDLVLEQVAPKMDMWVFEGGVAPLRNYISWFILALSFHSILRLTGIRITNRLAPFILLCQGAFFILLFIFFKIAK